MPSKDNIKFYSMKEIAEHNSHNSLWLLIDNCVYDVTKFLEEHPGGDDVLIEQAGEDATDPFEDVGHSSDARELMKEYKIGELCEEERGKGTKKAESSSSCFWVQLLLPVGVLLAATYVTWRYYHYK